jgi:hypothetical protein
MGFIIFSASKNNLTPHQNGLNHQAALNMLAAKGITFKEVQGCDHGFMERSILVRPHAENIVAEMCGQFNQECYLKVTDHNKEAWKVYTDNAQRLGTNEEFVGMWKQVSEYVAEMYGSYTYDMGTKRYYTIVTY